MNQILYHGSYIAVEAPLVSVGRRELDFGPGFCVTNLRDQAERWARRVYNPSNRHTHPVGVCISKGVTT